jgi:hypothetical protein
MAQMNTNPKKSNLRQFYYKYYFVTIGVFCTYSVWYKQIMSTYDSQPVMLADGNGSTSAPNGTEKIAKFPKITIVNARCTRRARSGIRNTSRRHRTSMHVNIFWQVV